MGGKGNQEGEKKEVCRRKEKKRGTCRKYNDRLRIENAIERKEGNRKEEKVKK